MNNKIYNEFNSYVKDKNISSLDLYYYQKKIKNSLTPYIIEERQMNITQLDIFSRLLLERIIWLAGEVNESMAIITQAQLMFLDSLNDTDITFHISSLGGSIDSGLSIISIMDYINSDIRTVNTGIAASMGAVILGAGTKGKRCSLKYSRTMIHQSSSILKGTFKDAKIDFIEWEKANEIIFKLLGEYCNKSPEQVKIDADRDLWFSPEETKAYGLIDEIIEKKI